MGDAVNAKEKEATAYHCIRKEKMKSQEAIFLFLLSNGYQAPRVLPDGRYAWVAPFLFTAGICTASPENVEHGLDERWCFHDRNKAIESLNTWNGQGDPEGWHRHIPSGRRRENADPLREYINP